MSGHSPGDRVLVQVPDDVVRRLEAIVAKVGTRGSGCVHLEQQPAGVVCIAHPAVVRCADCATAHIKAHTDEFERTCDVCGSRFDGKDYAGLVWSVVVDTTVSIGRGRRAAIGVIVVGGWGACSACLPTIAIDGCAR